MATYERPPRDETKARTTDEARTFNKATSEHGRPPVTDHDMHEDIMNDPPHNVPEGSVPGGTIEGMKAPKNSEAYSDDIPEGAMGEGNMLGRRKKDDIQAQLIDESENISRA